VALGALPYARLELVAVSVLAPAIVWAYCTQSHMVPRLGLRTFVGVVMGLVGTYFVFSRIVFGSATPVSGQLKHQWSERGGLSLWENFQANLALDVQQERLVLAAVAVTIVVVPWALRRYRGAAYATQHGLDIFLLCLAASQVAQFLYAAATTLPRYSEAPWYFASTRLLSAILLPLLLCRGFLLGVASFSRPVMVLLAALLTQQTASRSDWYFTRLKHCEGVDWEIAEYDAAQWVNRRVPQGAVVGSADSGVYSFFTDHRVINLDGLVNSSRYAEMQKGQQLTEWLANESGIQYYANAAIPERIRDVCDALGLGMRQNAPVSGRCTLLYTGLEYEGKRAAVWRYEPVTTLELQTLRGTPP
jgi:hypothetical protein